MIAANSGLRAKEMLSKYREWAMVWYGMVSYGMVFAIRLLLCDIYYLYISECHGCHSTALNNSLQPPESKSLAVPTIRITGMPVRQLVVCPYAAIHRLCPHVICKNGVYVFVLDHFSANR